MSFEEAGLIRSHSLCLQCGVICGDFGVAGHAASFSCLHHCGVDIPALRVLEDCTLRPTSGSKTSLSGASLRSKRLVGICTMTLPAEMSSLNKLELCHILQVAFPAPKHNFNRCCSYLAE